MEVIQTAHCTATSKGRADAARRHASLVHHLLPVAKETLNGLSAAFARVTSGVATISFETPLMAEALSAALDGRPARLMVKGPEVVGEYLIDRPGMSGLVSVSYVERIRTALIDAVGPQVERVGNEPDDSLRKRQDSKTNARLAAQARKTGGHTLYFCLSRDKQELSSLPETRELLLESFPALRLIEFGRGAPDEQDLVPIIIDLVPSSFFQDGVKR